jgi:hypothetical protein
MREKFGELVKLTKTLPTGIDMPKNIKFPDDFELDEDQISKIRGMKNSELKYRAILDILLSKQSSFIGETLVPNEREMKFKDTLKNIGVLYAYPPQIKADLGKIRNKLISGGIILKNQDHGVKRGISNASDPDIIRYFRSIAYGLLSYYRCADNLTSIKRLVLYTVKFSLLNTLMFKHKLNKSETLAKFGNPISCLDHKKQVVKFLSDMEINNLRKQFLVNIRPDPLRNIEKIIIRTSNLAVNEGRCAVRNCENPDIEVHHIKQLFRNPNPDRKGPYTVISSGRALRVTGQLAIDSALNRKQIPLCKHHHNE